MADSRIRTGVKLSDRVTWNKDRMHIRAIGYDGALGVPFAPRNIQYGGFGHEWSEVARTRRKPLLVRESPKLRTLSFDMYVGPKDGVYRDMAPVLRKLQDYANTGAHIMIYYNASFENVLWRLVDFTFESKTRNPVNEIIEADCHLEFKEIQDYYVPVGPVSGGVRRPTPTAKAKKVTKYTVKRGDSLSGIAIKFYRDARKWTTIAKANKITRPDRLRVGQVLTIPGK